MTMYLYTKVLMTFTRTVQWQVYFIWHLQSDVEILCKVETRVKECGSILRDESSVYFNVTAKHLWHLVATVYKPTVPCMITIELSDI